MRKGILITSILAFALCAFLLFQASLQLSRPSVREGVESYETLTGYNIYRNGDLVEEAWPEAEYSVSTEAFGEDYVFVVDLDQVEGSYSDPTLAFRSYSAAVKVWQDDEMILSLEADERMRMGGYNGGLYLLASLEDDWKDSTIRIEYITSFEGPVHNFTKVVVGNRADIVRLIVSSNLPSLLLAFCLYAMAIVMFIMTFTISGRTARRNLLSSIFPIVITATWILTQNWSKQLVINNVSQALDISYLVMALLPLSLLSYIRRNYGVNLRKTMSLFTHFAYLIVLTYVVMYTSYLFFRQEYSNYLIVLASEIMIFLLALTAACALRWAKERYEGGILLVLGLVLYTIPVVLEQIILTRESPLELQLAIYAPYILAIIIFIFTGIKMSLESSRTSEERRKAFALAYTDPLTGLLNRNALDNRLQTLEREMRSPVYIFMFDLDRMKEWNDTYGHAAGDRMITDFATSLREATANLNCYIFRYGGDEFLLMVEEEGPFNSKAIVDDIRRIYSESAEHPVNFSVGTVRYRPGLRHDIMKTVDEADSMMYSDKLTRKERLKSGE